MARLYSKRLYQGATRPILREEVLHRNGHDDAHRAILAIQSGAFGDVKYPKVSFTALSAMTAGAPVSGGATQIRGGSVT